MEEYYFTHEELINWLKQQPVSFLNYLSKIYDINNAIEDELRVRPWETPGPPGELPGELYSTGTDLLFDPLPRCPIDDREITVFAQQLGLKRHQIIEVFNHKLH